MFGGDSKQSHVAVSNVKKHLKGPRYRESWPCTDTGRVSGRQSSNSRDQSEIQWMERL